MPHCLDCITDTCGFHVLRHILKIKIVVVLTPINSSRERGLFKIWKYVTPDTYRAISSTFQKAI